MNMCDLLAASSSWGTVLTISCVGLFFLLQKILKTLVVVDTVLF